jgi:hypothetical protein
MRLRLQPLGTPSGKRLIHRGLTEARAEPAPPLKRRRKRRRGLQPLALLLFAGFFVSGCGSSHQQAVSTQAESVWPGVLAAGSNQNLVEAFNAYLARRQGPASPTQLALEFVRADRTQSARTTTAARSSPEGGGPTTVRVVQDGLADDSVRATQDVLRFVPSGGKWRLKSAVRMQRCQPGRGHQSFALGDCI